LLTPTGNKNFRAFRHKPSGRCQANATAAARYYGNLTDKPTHFDLLNIDDRLKLRTCFSFCQYVPFGKCRRRSKKMTTTNFVCGLDAALAVIGGKWKPLILFHLAHESRRYGDLRRAIGKVSDKMLIQQLKELEADGIVARFDFKEIPPKVEYSLTAFGKTLSLALQPLCVWGTEHMVEVEELFKRRSDAEAAF
jgi:DNA-binding HxlR family transcriptional regulator